MSFVCYTGNNNLKCNSHETICLITINYATHAVTVVTFKQNKFPPKTGFP